jgi:putative oxidoreductase
MRIPSHPGARTQPGAHLLRIGVAALLFIHGAARVGLGIVPPFGDFLNSKGLPAGLLLAWTLTIAELARTPLLAARRFVTPIAAFFIVELAAGIALVHWPAGWFVVGAGRNGMEYSVLLILALGSVVLFERTHPVPSPEPSGKANSVPW